MATWSPEKLKTLYPHFHKTYGNQTWQDRDLGWELKVPLLLTIILMRCKKFYCKQSILKVLLLPCIYHHIFGCKYAKILSFMYVAKREIQDQHVIKCKHNLSVIYSDYSLCGILVALNISIYVGRNREKRSREALLTQHQPLYLFNVLKLSFKKCSLRAW